MQNKAGILLIIVLVFLLGCKTNKPNNYQIAFYNVENLYDTINDPNINDGEFTPDSPKKWNIEKYNLKIKNISKVIADMGKDVDLNAPTVIGLAEIENKQVLEDLIRSPNLKKANYTILHKDSPDKRGIDVALLYDPNSFKLIDSSFLPLYIYDKETNNRVYTRDLLVAKGTFKKDTIFILVNHWPSRYGGLERSIPSRKKAAELNRSVIDSLLAINKNTKIITMGDLNDNPTDIAVDSTLNTVNEIDMIKDNELYNPMYNIYKAGNGTEYYRGNWNLFDQIILSKGLAETNSKGLHMDTICIFNKAYLLQQDGKYKGNLLRTFAGKNYLKGYSDHLPVYIILK